MVLDRDQLQQVRARDWQEQAVREMTPHRALELVRLPLGITDAVEDLAGAIPVIALGGLDKRRQQLRGVVGNLHVFLDGSDRRSAEQAA